VLTGIIASLMARALEPWDAARLGAYLHGQAGDLAADKYGEESLTALDIIEALPNSIQQFKDLVFS
jgi:NAD(P)H-hydrate repair Nnr-like enzyme with NAD(P)H-hydrate dehydratase domain